MWCFFFWGGGGGGLSEPERWNGDQESSRQEVKHEKLYSDIVQALRAGEPLITLMSASPSTQIERGWVGSNGKH